MADDITSLNTGLASFTAQSLEQKKIDDQNDLASVAEQFEAMFVYQLLKSGRAAKLYDDPLNTSAAKPFLEMMDQEISQKVSNKRSLGIAEAIVAQFERK